MTRSSLAFIASCALEEAACLWSDDVRKLSSKFAVIQKEGGMSLLEKHQSMEKEDWCPASPLRTVFSPD